MTMIMSNDEDNGDSDGVDGFGSVIVAKHFLTLQLCC